MKRQLLTLLALILAGVGGYMCTPKKPAGDATTTAALGAKVDTVLLHRTATTLWVVAHFHASSGATVLADTAGFNTSGIAPAQGHGSLPATTTVDSFGFVLPSTSQSGYFCLWAGNAGGFNKTSACASWSYTGPVAPPAPPVVDSIRVTPASWNLAAMTPQCQTAISAGAQWADYTHAKMVSVCIDSAGRPMQIQACTFAHWNNQTWTRVTNDTASSRCRFVWDSLPWTNKVSSRFAHQYKLADGRLFVTGTELSAR